ncbi:pyridoxamine 5'-phosphate oxidase family protein [Amycolatopsis sp. cmx-4-68]|uniref:pyridoxamine 5'-phosphate oxidase family protein n=1 Tax=Amycolatopsis sp. cmx-4-68 TaxID=2790938 RepID=UPI00397D613B
MDEKVSALLRAPNFAHIATTRRDRSASVTPVWVDVEGEHVLVNGTPGRAWARNLSRDPRVTLSVSALGNPYECATLRGHSLTPVAEGAEEHFQRLFRKYRNRTIPASDDTPPDDSFSRRIFRIEVESVHYQWQPAPDAAEEYDAFLAQMMNPAS